MSNTEMNPNQLIYQEYLKFQGLKKTQINFPIKNIKKT